jgi:hypothetical protein
MDQSQGVRPQWFAAKCGEIDDDTQSDYAWQLSSHLLPFFAKHRLSQITVAEVDRYRDSKVRESSSKAAAIAAWRERVAKETDRARLVELRRQRPSKPLSPSRSTRRSPGSGRSSMSLTSTG